MPHLSPLSWAILPILFWATLFMIISSFWWHQSPTLPQLTTKTQSSHSTWEWNCPKSN